MGWDNATLNLVWGKGIPIPNFDDSIWRHDSFGYVMKYTEYGNTNSQYGWEVDHIQRVADGGGDELSNLRPLSWEANRSRQ